MKLAMDRRRFTLGGIAANAAFATGGGHAFAQAAPVKIRVGWVVVPASTAPLVLEKKELLKHFGQSYVAETTRFAGTPPVITALAAGELDVGPLAFSSFGLAIENANMDDLRVIADEVQDGVSGHGTNQFMVLKDGPIKTVADLRGKVLATNAMGSAVDVAMRAMLRKSGLEANKDYTVVEAPFPAMRAMLAERKADLISAVPPFSLDPDLGAIARTLFTQKDAFGITQLTMWTARTSFIRQNRAALVDFLEDTLRAIRWYIDPKNHDEATAIVARLNKAPVERMGWAFTDRDQYRDPDGMPNLSALTNNLRQQKEVGLLKGDIDVKKYSDVSMVQEAAKRLTSNVRHDFIKFAFNRRRQFPLASFVEFLRSHRAADRRHGAVHGEHGLDGDRDVAARCPRSRARSAPTRWR
jgi:sulfonate transport system substrate-binding protein